MRISNKVTMLFAVLFFLSTSSLQGQQSNYSSEQIIGKWVLKSASFNGEDVTLTDIQDQISFEFTTNGTVTLNCSSGEKEKGEYIIEENKLIAPEVPELLNANIVNLTNEELILSMSEDRNEVVMVFALAGRIARK